MAILGRNAEGSFTASIGSALLFCASSNQYGGHGFELLVMDLGCRFRRGRCGVAGRQAEGT